MIQLQYFISTLLILLASFLGSASLTSSFSWRGNYLRLKGIDVAYSKDAPFKMPSAEPIDTYIGDTADDSTSGNFPMLPEAKPVYPGDRLLIFTNEMKFRELMSDCKSIYSNELVRCYVDETGGINRIGLLCRIIEGRLLKSGQAMYIIEGTKLIQVDGITVRSGKSYLSSTSTRWIEEELTDEEIETNEKVSITLFFIITKFTRLNRILVSQESIQAGKEVPILSGICLTPNMVKHRPGQLDYKSISQVERIERHNNFSFSCGNFVVGSEEITQKFLVSSVSDRLTDLVFRLQTILPALESLVMEFVEKYPSEGLSEDMARLKLLDGKFDFSDIAPDSDRPEFGFTNFTFDDDEEDFGIDTAEIDADVMQ